jgi:autotransporter-associated beta strand protein
MVQKKNTPFDLSNAADQAPAAQEAAAKPQRKRKVRPAAEMLVLEQRMMFDGAAMSTADLLNERNTTSSDKATPLYRETPDLFTPQALPPQPGRLIVISAALPEAERIRLGLADKGEVVALAEDSDALSQISQLLASRSQIEELHIISHGEPGTLLLGDLRLDNSTLQARQAEILNWQSSLTANADILLYGCDVGSGDAGLVFLQTLQGLTGADVAASSDDTGSRQLGGNTTLELSLGQVDATSALDTELLDALGLLLDTTPPAAATTQISFSGAAITVTVNLTESVATSTDLSNSALALTTGGAARSASFVAAESDLATGKLVYRYNGSDFSQGVQLGQISLNGAVIRDAAGNALTPTGLTPLLSQIDVTEGQSLSFNGGYTGSGDFIKTGLGELILTGNSTHSGNTVVRGGTLTITSDLQLGPDVSSATAGRLVIEDGAKLKINATLALDPERGIRMNGQGTIEVASGFTATYNGIISGANASSGLIKTGLGTLVLGGAHSYSGTTDIQAGVLAVNGSLADATTVKVAQGATYQLNTSDTVAGIEGAGSITSGAITGAVATLTVSGNTTPFNGVIGDGTAGGKLALTKVGSDTLTLSGLNTYTGATSINAGTLLLNEGGYRTPSFNIATGAVLQLHTDARLDYGTNTNFTGTGTLLKTGFGMVMWGTTAATFAMGTGSLIDVQGGTFVAGSSANEVWTNNLASLNVAAQAVFRTVEADVRVDALTGSGAIQMGFGGYPNSGLTVGVNNFAAGSFNSAGSANFSGTFFDFGRLIKAGTGTLTLSGNSVHTGATTVQAGTLRLGVDQAFSASSALTINPGATFDLNGKRQSLVSVVQGTGTGVASLTLGTGGQLEINGNNLTFAGVISGDGSLRKVGNTTLTLTGASTFTGETHIVQGTLTLGASGALGPDTRNSAPAVNTTMIIGESGSLNLNGFNQRIGSLAGAGTLTLGTGMLVVGGNNADTTFTGVFSTTGTGTLGRQRPPGQGRHGHAHVGRRHQQQQWPRRGQRGHLGA